MKRKTAPHPRSEANRSRPPSRARVAGAISGHFSSEAHSGLLSLATTRYLKPVSALVVIGNRQRKVRLDLPFIKAVAEFAWPACRSALRSRSAPLGRLKEIEVTILGNLAITKVHRDYFNEPTPTDVITFPYGEILIGAGVVCENAARFGKSPSEEAALCVVHGLLHLAGWNDQTSSEAKDMARKQEQIFKMAHRMVCSRNQ